MDAHGAHLQYLTDNGKDYFNGPHDRNPAFSPDGKFIVFERHAPDFSNSAIYLMRVDGGGLKSLAVFPRTNERPSHRLGGGQLKRIEDGGAIPRWGAVPD